MKSRLLLKNLLRGPSIVDVTWMSLASRMDETATGGGISNEYPSSGMSTTSAERIRIVSRKRILLLQGSKHRVLLLFLKRDGTGWQRRECQHGHQGSQQVPPHAQ